MTLITDTETLRQFCAAQKDAEFLAVDTEFMRDKTYWPILCLVQIAGPDQAAAIDILSPGLDLTPLKTLLNDQAILKVFHAVRQDIEVLLPILGAVPRPLMDTQIAAMVCGFGESVSYETLVNRLVNATLDKTSRFTDWAHRPLTERQIDYAISDVTHLRVIHQKLARRMEKEGRIAWIQPEIDALYDEKQYRTDPREAWRRLKPRSDKPRFLSMLQELAAWREEEAQRRDLPRQRVLKDDQILEIAAHNPRNIHDLARLRGIGTGIAQGAFGAAILKALDHARARPEQDCPRMPPRAEPVNGSGAALELLRVLLKARSDEANVAPRLVASASDLETLVSGRDTSPVLMGWRYDLFGKEAQDLLRGMVSLAVIKGQVVALPIPPKE